MLKEAICQWFCIELQRSNLRGHGATQSSAYDGARKGNPLFKGIHSDGVGNILEYIGEACPVGEGEAHFMWGNQINRAT